MITLPHRYKESTFRVYEPFIKRLVDEAVINWPTCTKIDPKFFTTAQTTFIARLRDAVQSYLNHNWPSSINRTKFTEIARDTQVSERADGTILFGHKTAIKSWVAADKIPLVPTTVSSDVIDLAHINAVNLLMTLSHNRLLSPRIIFTGVNDVDIETSQQNFDIAIDKNPDGTYTLL
jgi:hypothetical protein